MAAIGTRLLTFHIHDGDRLVRRESIEAESVPIGASAAAMVRVEDSEMADLQAVLNVNEDGTVQLLDLVGDGSSGINGVATANAELRRGDRITVGNIQLTVQIAAPHPAYDDDDTLAEDVMSFVLRNATNPHDASGDRSRGKVLEVAQVFGNAVVDVRHFNGVPVTLGSGIKKTLFGEGWESAFFVPEAVLPHAHFPIFEGTGGRWTARISERWAGFLDIGDRRHSFPELLASGAATRTSEGCFLVTVEENCRLIVDVGNSVFVAHTVFPGKLAANASPTVDWPVVGIVAFMGFVTAALSLMVVVTPPPAHSVQELTDHQVNLLLEKPTMPPATAAKDATAGAKAKEPEGKVGKQNAVLAKAKGEKQRMDKQEIDKELALKAGIIGTLALNPEMERILGEASMSRDMMDGIGGMTGARGIQMGTSCLGGRDGGLGGNDHSDSLGRLGTHGRSAGETGYGERGGDWERGPQGRGIRGIAGIPTVMGSMDKALIDEVVKRNMNQIRYCYTREVSKHPNLGGKVTVKFVIGKDGTVASATTKASTVGSAAVDSCINGRFMRFQFPEPKGGGIVIVSYPFIFAQG